jgi:MFS family permease
VAAPRTSLRQNRDFNIFWGGQALSVLGDAFVLIAVPLLVLDATGSVAQMGLVTAVFGLGSLVAGVFTGAIVDRVDRRRLMVQCDLGRLAVYALVPLGWWLLGPQLWLVYLVTFVGAALAMLFGVAYITAVANLVDRDQLIDANSRLHATYAVGFVLGPMLAGLVADRFGAATAIGCNALTFAASALSLGLVRFRRSAAAPPTPAAAPSGAKSRWDLAGGRWAMFDGLAVGFRFLLGDPLFRSLTLLMGGLALVTTGVLDLFIFYLKEDLGQTDRAVGIVFGIASVGSILGGVLAPRLRRGFGFGACFVAGFALQGVAMAAIGLAPTLTLVALFAVCYTFAESIRGIATMSLRQEVTPDHLLGRVTAAFWIVFSAPGPLGAAAVTALAARVGVTPALCVTGGLAVLCALLAARGPAGARRPEVAAAERLRLRYGDDPRATSDAPPPPGAAEIATADREPAAVGS